MNRIAIASFSTLCSGAAAASDYSGTFAFLMGFPALLVGIVFALSLASASRTSLQKYGGMIVSACLVLDIVVAKGAADLSINRLGFFVYIYLAACVALLYLQYRLIKAIPPQSDGDDSSKPHP